MKQLNTIPARYYARFCNLLNKLGYDPAPLLRTAGIDRRDIHKPHGQLTMSQVDTFVQAAVSTTGRTDLGLELARMLKLSSHNSVSFGILSSPTGGYALHFVARYFSLILPCFRMIYSTDAKYMRITVTPAWAMSRECLAFHLEMIAGAVHWEWGELIGGSLPAYDIYFSLHEPSHINRYTQLRPARVHFNWQDQPGLLMQWPIETTKRPVALADTTALKLAEQRCNDMVAKVRQNVNIADWVSMMLREANDGAPSMGELAHTLNLSPRTLDRYLQQEGESFRELSKKVLLDKACTLLADPVRSVTQVAYELGYSDVANFTRAFRRYKGSTPSVWRAENPMSDSRAH